MPRYDFQCRQCSYTFEIELPFGSDESPMCPECKGNTNKLISPPAIHFKGSGFYNSDNRKENREHASPGAETKVEKGEDTKESKESKALKEKPKKVEPKTEK